MPILTIIRHAETECNIAGIFAGRIDCDITRKGFEEASKLLSEKEKDFDYIFISPLKRAKQTLDAMLHGSIPIVDKRLIAMSIGEWEGKKKNSFNKDLVYSYRLGKYTPLGAETISQVDERVCDFIESIFNNYNKNDKILIITHSTVMRSIKRNFVRNCENIILKNLEKIILTEDDFIYFLQNKN